MNDKSHERAFESIEERNREILEDLHCEIEKFVSNKDAFFSDDAGSSIFKTWHRASEWEAICGSRPMSGSVFGVALYRYLPESDWEIKRIDGAMFYQRTK